MHYTWRHSVGRLITDDRFPTNGKMDCAVDVCLVMERVMRLGLVNCDQLPLDEMRGLPQLTRIYRAAIARPWHNTHQTRLNDTRTELANMIRFPKGMEGINPEREAMFFVKALDPLLEGARCAAFTVITYLYCRPCNAASPATSIANRLSSIAKIDPNIKPDRALGMSHFINLFSAPQKTQDDTRHTCGRLRQPVNVIIDRLPPFLLLRDGWENFTEEWICNDVSVKAHHYDAELPGIFEKEVMYSWAGLVDFVADCHFILYWRIEPDKVLIYNGERDRQRPEKAKRDKR